MGGPSGGEGPASELLLSQWRHHADEVGGDALGNVWARLRGDGPTVVLAAHIDLIGLVVTRVVEGGFLRFAPVGGLDVRSLLGREVVVYGRQEVPALVATIPPHLTSAEGRRHLPPVAELALDTGLSDRALQRLVRPGDRGRLMRPATGLLGDCLCGVGLDNRAGLAALHEALLTLGARRPPCDLYMVANVQEEVGLRGVGPLAQAVRPLAAVVVDVGFAHQPGAPEHQTRPLGAGPVLATGPAFHPAVAGLIRAAAHRLGVGLSHEVIAGASGTDAWAVQVAAGGVATALLSIPLRSMHTPAETIAYADVAATGQLLAAAAAGMDAVWAAGLGRTLARGGVAVP